MCKCHIDHVDVTLVVLFTIAVGTLFLCSFLVIRPYLIEDALMAANCTVEEINYHGDNGNSRVDDGCVLVTVSYTAVYEDGHMVLVHNGTLYDSPEMFHKRCSTRARHNYLGRWNTAGHSGPCWFNPMDPSQVLARRKESFWGTINSALWPFIVILGTASIFIARRCTPSLQE